MFYQLVSQLQPFQATKASTNHYGTDETEAACKNPAYQAGCEGEGRTCRGGEYDVDISKFFKLVSTNVDQTIFED
jgi:hypothetical protein